MARALHDPEFMDLDDFEDFVLDKPEDEKWELVDGRILRSMVGARWTHHQIIQNVNFALRSHILAKGLPCQTFTETFWLKQRFQKLAAFPDIMVRCGPIDPDAGAIDDPLVLIEVVSPSSRGRDRGDKAAAYTRLPSARHVCFIDRDSVRVDGFDRSGESWVARKPVESMNGVFELPALEFAMPVAAIYADVFRGS